MYLTVFLSLPSSSNTIRIEEFVKDGLEYDIPSSVGGGSYEVLVSARARGDSTEIDGELSQGTEFTIGE